MLSALIIVFREVLEAGLVVGVVMAATRGVARRDLWIGLGLGAGLLGAGLVAIFARQIASAFDGSGQETMNAAVLLLAVVMLAWHNAWMAVHGRELARTLKAVGRDVSEGRRPLAALAVVCGVAVLREGSEVVLFLYGVAAGGGVTAVALVTGGLLGIVAGGLASAALYAGLIAIPLRHLFATLSLLITLLAAGLAAQSVNFLQQGDWLDLWSATAWDSTAFLPQDGAVGSVLHTLVGYTAQPSLMQVVTYGVVVVSMLALNRAVRMGARPRP